MRKILTNKKLSYIMAVLTLVLLLLVCILLTQLVQIASFNNKINHLQSLIQIEDGEIQKTNELLEYMQSNEYIIQWAIDHELLPADADSWIKK